MTLRDDVKIILLMNTGSRHDVTFKTQELVPYRYDGRANGLAQFITMLPEFFMVRFPWWCAVHDEYAIYSEGVYGRK